VLLPHRQNVSACVRQPIVLVAVRYDRRFVDKAVPTELLEALLYLTRAQGQRVRELPCGQRETGPECLCQIQYDQIEPIQLELFGLFFAVRAPATIDGIGIACNHRLETVKGDQGAISDSHDYDAEGPNQAPQWIQQSSEEQCNDRPAEKREDEWADDDVPVGGDAQRCSERRGVFE